MINQRYLPVASWNESPLEASPAGDAGFAWAGNAVAADLDGACSVDAAHVAAFDVLAAGAPGSNIDPGQAMALPGSWQDIGAWMHHRLHGGPGYALLRDIPFAEQGPAWSRRVVWSIANALGVPITQTATGERVVDVCDQSRGDASPRQFKTSRELRLHTDPCSDLIGLACLRPGLSGGESVLCSAVRVHDEMSKRRPDLLALLYRGFHWHRFGEGRVQDGPYTAERVPVFSRESGGVSCRYVRSPIVAGHQAAGIPLEDCEVEALDELDRIACSPEMRLVFRLRAGDLLWVNNIKVMHARTEFVDPQPPLPPRHLLRLWLAAPNGVERAPARLNFFNGGECGMPLTLAADAYDMTALREDAASGGAARLGVSSGSGS